MRQVLQPRRGAVVVRDVPSPPCPPAGVLVRNRYSVISSGTERARAELSRRSLVGKARERPDLVREVVDRARREGIGSTRAAVRRQLDQEAAVGYSSAGVVVEVGPAVRGLAVGDRVACAGGGHANHAELVAIPRNLCARVPDGVPLEVAAFGTIAAIALHGVRLAGVALGERAAVIGCGLVGQLACRLLRAAGAEVFALDVDASRVRDAVAAGADHGLAADARAVERIERLTGGLGVDHALVTAAAPTSEPLGLAAEIARERGTVVLVGAVPVELPRAPLYEKELALRVSRSYGPGRYDLEYEQHGLDYPLGYVRWTEQRNLESVLDLVARGRLRLDDLVDEVVPVAEAGRAYARLLGENGAPRPRGAIVLSYPGEGELGEEGVRAPAAARLDGESAGGGNGASESPPLRLDAAAGAARAPVAKRGIGPRPVRLGLIGPGSFATRVLVPAFRAAGARLELVGGGSGPSAEAAQRKLGFARVAPDEAAVIADPDVDAVAICTRHGSHARLARQALEAGKHVFCEKPLALTVEELDAVMEAARRSQATLTVGFNRRFSPHLREVERLCRTVGGRVIASYRVNAGRLRRDHWTHDLEQGGGRLLGEAGHFIDALAFVAGSPITAVYAAGYGDPQLPVQARDNVVITLSFADGSVGTVVYAADGSPRVGKERLEVSCGELTAVVDDYRVLEVFGGRDVKRTQQKRQDKGHGLGVRSFLEGVRSGTGTVPIADLENTTLALIATVTSLQPATVHNLMLAK